MTGKEPETTKEGIDNARLMGRTITVLALALIAGGLALALAPRIYVWWQQNTGASQFMGNKKAISEGAKLYRRRCQSCHGEEGDMSEHHHPINAHIHMHNPQNYFDIISNGERKLGMPAFKDYLSEAQRWKITSYLFSRFNANARNSKTGWKGRREELPKVGSASADPSP